MNQPNTAKPRYGQERTCPHCGARVAQRARTCFSCGASLENGPRRRRSVPWADITLFAVIGGLVVLWWLHPTNTQGRPLIDLLSTATPSLGAQPTATLALLAANVRSTPGAPDTLAAGTPVLIIKSPAPTLSPTLSSVPSATFTPVATNTPVATASTYKVKNGDTLQVIADHYNTTVKAIIDLNNLSADGFIRLDQELQIPAPGVGGAEPSQPQPTPTPTGGTLVYRVAAGDTIAGIAGRYGSSIEWILQANKLKENDYLSIGQSLLVPLSNSTPQPTATSTAGPATPTATPGPRFRSPVPVEPVADGVMASDSDVLLSWTSVGVLSEDQWYVVTLTTADGKPLVAPFWTKSTNWRLSPEIRTGSQGATGATITATSAGKPTVPAPEQFIWQVQVVSGQPGKEAVVLSPPSDVRRFQWR